MEAGEIYEAFREALADHAKSQEDCATQLAPGMIAIEPFNAETVDAEPVRVVGIVTSSVTDAPDFVVLKTIDGGEMIVTVEGSVWPVKRRKVKAAAAP